MLHAAEVRVTEKAQIEAPGSELRVFRGDAASPLFGSVTRDGEVVRFTPAVPFVPGGEYRVEFQTKDGAWSTQHLRFEPSKAEAPTVNIAPSPTVLPANALKVYLHFTQPMEQGVFLERIALHRQDGSVVSGAFRETELWSRDGRRLTLWLHPGRQKAGVNLNLDEGPVLREGENHTLKIAAAWRSTAGTPLERDASFVITAGAADHVRPDPARWRITAPKAGTHQALRVDFEEALDPAMLVAALSVNRGKARLSGAVEVAADARTWLFTPSGTWLSGSYTLEIDPLLEDLAGNNLMHSFEVNLAHEKPPSKTARLVFEIR
jgi:hypothetical protein